MKGMQSNMVQNKHIFAICCLACILRANKKKENSGPSYMWTPGEQDECILEVEIV